MASNDQNCETLVLLLHGLGLTGAVWQGVQESLAEHLDVKILAPDLPGHGSSPAAAPYTVARHAAFVASLAPPHRRLIVVGHSMAGYVALALASGAYGLRPAAVASIGAKLNFSQTDLARGPEFAVRPVRWYPTREAAEERYRIVAGLPAARFAQPWCIERGVVAGAVGFRLASDPAIFGIQVPPFAELLSKVACPVRVVRGESDSLVSREECAALPVPFTELAGLGHNAQVEDPARVARFIEELLTLRESSQA